MVKGYFRLEAFALPMTIGTLAAFAPKVLTNKKEMKAAGKVEGISF